MSFEVLLLLVFLVLLPLVELLLRAFRTGTGARSEPTAEQPAPARHQEPARHPLQRPPVRKLPAAVPATASEAQAPRRRDAAGPAALAAGAAPGPRWRTAVMGGLDLRRAIVLMTILEPCRAVNPQDGPKSG